MVPGSEGKRDGEPGMRRRDTSMLAVGIDSVVNIGATGRGVLHTECLDLDLSATLGWDRARKDTLLSPCKYAIRDISCLKNLSSRETPHFPFP
jgi:hypothetical protein